MRRPRINRITVNFSEEAVDWLASEAALRSTSIADLIRRIVDETRGAFVIKPRKP
jgi:hypothetical protein